MAGRSTPIRLSVVTTSRADFGIYQPVLKALATLPDIDLGLIVTGMHLSPEFGNTLTDVKKSGFAIHDQFECLMSSDTEEGVSKAMGLATASAAQSFQRKTPDFLMALGDRFEMHAVVLAALPFRIPVIHLHGGEETEGAIDNALRHSITKLSHLHLCATELSARRIRALGENPEQVHVVGAPSLDNVSQVDLLTREELHTRFSIPEDPFNLVTYHPVTLNPERSIFSLKELWTVLKEQPELTVFTLANADTAGRALNEEIRKICESSPDKAMFVGHMGSQGYFSAMSAASLMVGNSSSGILEAASFGLPVINLGDRQAGRERSPNTIDCAETAEAITQAMERARSKDHRAVSQARTNVYGDGQSSDRIKGIVEDFIQHTPNVSKSFHLGGSA